MIEVPSRFATGTHNAITKRLARVALFEFPASASGSRSPTFFAWTDWPAPIPYKERGVASGTALEFQPGFAPLFSALRKERHMRPHTIEISGPLASNPADGFTLDDFTSGAVRGARLTHWVVDPHRPNVRSPFRDRFFLDDPEFVENEYRMPMVSARERLRRLRGDIATPSCRRELGDRGCGIPLIAGDPGHLPQYRVSGALAVPDGSIHNRIKTRLQFTDATSVPSTFFSAGWFSHGELIGVTSTGTNLNLGRARKIAFSGSAFNPTGSGTSTWRIDIDLLDPMPFNIQGGDLYDIVVGCDKNYTTCQIKFPTEPTFGNRRRFLGEPFIIGTDRLIRSADAN